MLENIILPLGFIYLVFIISWLIGKRNISFIKLNIIIILYCVFVKILQKADFMHYIFDYISKGLIVIQQASIEGASFIFGHLSSQKFPVEVEHQMLLFIFAFQVLPITIVFSAIFALLNHFGIMQFLIQSIGSIIRKTLNISSVLSLNLSANIFLGQTDAIMFIKNHLNKINKREAFTMMAAGMATTAFSVVPLYSLLISSHIQNPSKHIILSTIFNIVLVAILSMLLIKDKKVALSQDNENISSDLSITNAEEQKGLFEAISEGTMDGVKAVTGIAAILIVIIAFLFIINQILSLFGTNLSSIFGYLLYPMMKLIGIPSADLQSVGSIIGLKTAANEIFAFIKFNEVGSLLSEKSKIMTIYAICGFSNFSSIGIQTAGIKAVCKDFKFFNIAGSALLLSIIVGILNAAIVGL